jgi:hypothetical protein
MQILLANMRQFYQCWRLWVAYLSWGFFLCCCLRLIQLGRDPFAVLVVLALPAAWVVTAVQEDVAAKPFSFCLPGHRSNVRRLIFLIGAIFSIIGGLCFALNSRSSDVSRGTFALIACSGSIFTWFIYLIGMAFTLAVGSAVAMSVLLTSVSVVAGCFGLDWRLDQAVLSHPFVVLSLAIPTGVIVWRWLGRPNWFRNRCGRPGAGVLSASVQSSEREERQIASSIEMATLPSAVERYLLRLCTAGRPAWARYMVSAAYPTLVPLFLAMLSWRVGVPWMFLLLAMFLVAGYLPGVGFFVVLLLVIAANGLAEGSPLSSEMLIHGGRRERFYVTTVLVAILAAVSGGILILLILVLNLLGPWFPDVTIRGFTFTFHRISLGLPMLLLIGFPVVGSLEFWLHARRGGGMIVFVIVFAGQMPFLLWCRHIPVIPLSTMVLTGVLVWFAFTLIIRRIAMRSDLVRR